MLRNTPTHIFPSALKVGVSLLMLTLASGCQASAAKPQVDQSGSNPRAALLSAPTGSVSEATTALASSAASLAERKTKTVVFKGMCDASAAVPLSNRLFAVADDEDNAIRIYDVELGGEPLAKYDLSAAFGLYPTQAKKPGKPMKAPPELDLEGATLYKGLAYWVTSHGRSKSGKIPNERLSFFATTVGENNQPIRVEGQVYETLIADLVASPILKPFELDKAAQIPSKEKGGFNIEGLTERQEGGVWIGFRNPLPENKALLVALLNPDEVIAGKPARFDDPRLLSLDGLGIRGLSWWRGHYLIAAGAYDGEDNSALFRWDGKNAPVRIQLPPSVLINPEAFFTPEDRDDIMFFNDQGNVRIAGQECKKLKDPKLRQFTGTWFQL